MEDVNTPEVSLQEALGDDWTQTKEAVEITPDGEQSLSSEEKAQASTEASPAGAPAEKEVSQPETPPVQESRPRVEVVEPTAQQPASAEAAPAAEEAKEEPKEDMTDALKKLTEFGDARAEEVRRTAQSAADKSTAETRRLIQESNAKAQQLTDSIRELEMRDLTDEEKAKVRETYAQQDERAELDDYRSNLGDLAKSTMVDSLMNEYRDYGVNQADLEAMEDSGEMELHCAQVANDFLANKLAERNEPKEETAAPKTEEPPVEQPKPEPRVANAPGVPAGAQAQSDVGASGVPPAETKFSEEQTTDAMQKNLRDMGWTEVRVRG